MAHVHMSPRKIHFWALCILYLHNEYTACVRLAVILEVTADYFSRAVTELEQISRSKSCYNKTKLQIAASDHRGFVRRVQRSMDLWTVSDLIPKLLLLYQYSKSLLSKSPTEDRSDL